MEQPPRKRSIEEIKRELAEQRQILAEALVAEAALKRDMNIEENIPPQIPTETRDGGMGDIDSIPARPSEENIPNKPEPEEINSSSTINSNEAKDAVKNMSPENREKLGWGLKIIGFKIEKKKNDFFAAALDLNNIKGIQKRGTLGRFLVKLRDTFVRDAKEAEKKGLDIQKGKDKAKLSKLKNLGLVSGNVLKYGRIVADVCGVSIANPLRYVTMAGMATARLAEAGKEARLDSDAVLDQTQLSEEDALEEAYLLYQQAQHTAALQGSTEVSAEILQNQYLSELPRNLQLKLENPSTSFGFVQKLLRNDMLGSINKLNKKIEKIENSKKTGSEKKVAKEKLLKSWEKDLKDYDRMITNYGTVDALAVSARYAQVAGKGIVLGMQIETAIVSVERMWRVLSNFIHGDAEISSEESGLGKKNKTGKLEVGAGNLNKNTPFAFRSIIEKYHVDPNGSLADAIKKAGGVDNIINELIRGEGSKIPSNPGNIMIPESGLLPGQRHSGVWILQKDRSGKAFYTELALYESPEAGRQAMRDIIEGAAKGNGTYGQNPTFAHFIAKYTGTNEENFGKGIVGGASKEEGLVSRTKKWIESFTVSKQNPPEEIIKFGSTDYVKEIENGQEVLVGKTYSADGKTLVRLVKIYSNGLRQDFIINRDGFLEKFGNDVYIKDETYFKDRGFKITLPAKEKEAPATPPTAEIPEKEKTEVLRENERVEKITRQTESEKIQDLPNKEAPQKQTNEIPAGTWIPARPGDAPTAGTWIPDEPTPKAPAAHVDVPEETNAPKPVASTKSATEVMENLTTGEFGNIKKWGFVMNGDDWVRNFKRNGVNYIEKISKEGERTIYRIDGGNETLIRTRKLFPSEMEDFNIKPIPEKPSEMLQKEPLRDDARLEDKIEEGENRNKIDVGSVDDQPTIDEEKIISEGKRILKDGMEEIVINGKLRIRIYPNGDREEYIYNPDTGKLHQFISRDEGLYNFSGNGELNYIKLPNGIEEFYTSGNLGPYLSKVLDSNGNDIDVDKYAQTAQHSPLPEINPAITPMDKVLEQARIEQEETSTPEIKPQRTISDIKEDIKNKIDSAETPQNIPSGVGKEMEVGRQYETYGGETTPNKAPSSGIRFHYTEPGEKSPYGSYSSTPGSNQSPYSSYDNRYMYMRGIHKGTNGENFYPDISPEDNELLNNNPEFFGQNPFHFTGKQLLEIYNIHGNNLSGIFRKNVELWSKLKSQPAYSIMKIKEGDAETTFKPLVSYLELLKKVTGLKPETRTIFHRAETLEEYIGRALQKAAQKNLLEKLKI